VKQFCNFAVIGVLT